MKRKYTVLGSGVLLLAFFVWLFVVSGPSGVVFALMMLNDIEASVYLNYLILGISELLLILPLIVYMAIARVKLASLMGNRTNWKQNLSGLLFGILLVPALSGVNTIFSELFYYLGLQPTDTSMMEPGTIGQLLVGMVAVGVTAGIVEEPIFRGVAQRGLGSAMGRRSAIVLTALFFSIIHLDLVGAPSRFIIGLVLGYMAWRCGAILPGILAHAAFNSTSLGISLLMTSVLPGWTGFNLIAGASPVWDGILTWTLISLPFAAAAWGVYRLFACSTPATSAWGTKPYAVSEVKGVHYLPWIGLGVLAVACTALISIMMWGPFQDMLERMTNIVK